jgi:hypothetical protein
MFQLPSGKSWAVGWVQLQDGSLGGSKLCALEPFLPGEYIKHNDNGGAVHTDEALPQVRPYAHA